jgi:KDO2-lipid IV(A) lauroyltransferase
MLTYYLLVPFFYLFAYLPTDVLYKISKALAFVLRNVVGYRHQVVFTNLRNSFPDKTEQEIKNIASQSYQHLADRIVENIRCLVITSAEIEKRITITNPEVLSDSYRRNHSVVLMVGHIGPWEFGGYRLRTACKYKLFGIVSLVSNPYFNRMIQRTRAKMGMELIPMNQAKDFFKKPLPELSLGIFISDQSPSNKEKAYWTTFLNQDTAFFTGGEGYARLHNCEVIYPKIVQVKHGYYTAELITIAENPNALAPNEITERFARLLEQHIQEDPSDWLWSHRRWKHKRNVEL